MLNLCRNFKDFLISILFKFILSFISVEITLTKDWFLLFILPFTKTIDEGPELDYEPHDLFGIVVAFPNAPDKIFNTKDLVLDI